jgi:hypothetical protein
VARCSSPASPSPRTTDRVPGGRHGGHPAARRYLAGLADEADRRGYHVDRGRIEQSDGTAATIPVTRGQLDPERRHLADRNPHRAVLLPAVPSPHPSFVVVAGPVEDWERAPR